MSHKVYQVPFLAGYDLGNDGEVMLDVIYIASGVPIAPDGQCAFCHGDVCAETPDRPGSKMIAEYYAKARQHNYVPDYCPCCEGRH